MRCREDIMVITEIKRLILIRTLISAFLLT